MVTVTLTAGVEELTLGPFESIDEAADAALARPDISSWRRWEFNAVQTVRQDWVPPNLDHLGQGNDKYITKE